MRIGCACRGSQYARRREQRYESQSKFHRSVHNHFQPCYCDRRKAIWPIVVRTRNIGPPPFKLPSANIALGPYSPLLVIFNPGKSEEMPLPVAMSDEACTVTGKLLGRNTVTLPAAVCSEESAKCVPMNWTVMGPAPVSTCAPWYRLYISTLPPPVVTSTRPWALARRTLPPPLSARREPFTSPKLRLPPSVLVRKSPSHFRTSMPPPPVCTVAPLTVPMYTLPPPMVSCACPAILLM